NTDDIYPSPGAITLERLKGISLAERMQPDNMALSAFGVWRWRPDGTPEPGFVLNHERYSAARILLAGENFGCGSSREHAVWCLMAIGIRCIIAPSFGDIFFGNCFKNGLLAVTLSGEEIAALATV